MTLQEQLRREIRKAVALSGLTQVAIATAADVSVGHLGNVLHGRKPVSLATAERIADACGVDLRITGHGRWT